MVPGPRHEIHDLSRAAGELSFEARIGDRRQRVWLRTESDLLPGAEAALATCVMPAMRCGGTLSLEQPVSPRLLRNQREFQAVQRAWSRGWTFGDPPLEEVEVLAPTETPAAGPTGRVAAFFSAGVDSWSTVLDHPEITDLIFVRGFDLLLDWADHQKVVDEVEARVRWAAGELGLTLHVVETNLRELSDPLVRWEVYYGCATAAAALFLGPLFERVLIAGDSDYEVQAPVGANRLVDQLWSTENLEIVDDGGRYNRVERTARIVGNPIVQQTLRVCWQNSGGSYNCGHCRKCLMTMLTLELLGARDEIKTFPPKLDLDVVAELEITQPVLLTLWEDILDAARAAGRVDLERSTEAVVARGKRLLGLPDGHRRRSAPGPPSTIRIATIVPVWRQSQYMAAAVDSALRQEIGTGVGVVIVDDGCPEPETDRIAQTLRDAHPDRVAYLRQPNRGLSAARNAGIRHAFARWPHLEAVFPLDADNLLSPHTLAMLWQALQENPGAGWVSPTLELFGAERGESSMPEPYLAYRQLFTNQSDAGALIHRSVFAAGIEFDETMRNGYEDWEFFLRATLAGFRGFHAGRCGFRYRRRTGSMLARAEDQSVALEAELHRRHPDAYQPGELARCEHLEAPRFGLVRCDAGDVLLTAACDLEPHRMSLDGFLCPRRTGKDAPPLQAHVPAVAVLTTAGAIEWLEAKGLLARTLLQLQVAVRDHMSVGLRIEGKTPSRRLPRRREEEAPSVLAALALRTRTLAELAQIEMPLRGDDFVEIEIEAGRGHLPEPLSEDLLEPALERMWAAAPTDRPLIPIGSQAQYFEHRHVDLLETTLPQSTADDTLDLAARLVA